MVLYAGFCSVGKLNYFELTGNYDLILEQTFFCAISPELREHYVEKTYNLLTPNGKLVGLLFNYLFEENGPPFGGNISEYRELFQDKFCLNKIEECYNSILPRKGKELFINFSKK